MSSETIDCITKIIDYIARTNLFNFLIFLSIIIFLYKKINVTGLLETAKKTVEENIEESKTIKADSENKLSEVKESISHIEEEIDAIIAETEDRAKLVGEKILKDAESTALTVRSNMEKALENSRATLKNELIKKATLASIEAARAHIISELNNNQGLHDRLIDESIDAIEGVQP